MKALNYEINVSELSPQLQVLVNLETRVTALEKKIDAKPTPVQMSFNDLGNFATTSDKKQTTLDTVVVPSSFVSKNDWRKETNKVICAINGHNQNYSLIHNSIYKEVEARAKCNLSIRLVNLKKNMIYNGASHSQAQRKNYLDVIEMDIKLINTYVSVVRELASFNKIKCDIKWREEMME